MVPRGNNPTSGNNSMVTKTPSTLVVPAPAQQSVLASSVHPATGEQVRRSRKTAGTLGHQTGFYILYPDIQESELVKLYRMFEKYSIKLSAYQFEQIFSQPSTPRRTMIGGSGTSARPPSGVRGSNIVQKPSSKTLVRRRSSLTERSVVIHDTKTLGPRRTSSTTVAQSGHWRGGYQSRRGSGVGMGSTDNFGGEEQDVVVASAVARGSTSAGNTLAARAGTSSTLEAVFGTSSKPTVRTSSKKYPAEYQLLMKMAVFARNPT